MAKDILSQNEIDSLIGALSSGIVQTSEKEEDNAEHREYDFRRPSKFSKEHIRTLQFVHDNYSRMLGNFLAAYLRVPVQVQLVSVSQVTYEEFVFSLPVPTLVTVFNMNADMGSAMLETNSSFVFPLIDLVFGGEGSIPKDTRELTDIELTVMRQINEKLLDNLRYVWEDIADITPRVEGMETNPQFNQIFASTETVALLTFSTIIKGNQGLLNLCFPFITLEKIMPKLTAQFWFKQTPQEVSRLQEMRLLRQLEGVEVDVSAVLGRTTVTLDDFLNFSTGDIIPLNRMEGDDLDILVEGEYLFKAQPGSFGQNVAIQITEYHTVEEEEERA